MNQFQSFLQAGLQMKKRKSQEDLAITALGSQGSSKDIQKVMRSFDRKKPQQVSSGVGPEEFSRRFNGGL